MGVEEEIELIEKMKLLVFLALLGVATAVMALAYGSMPEGRCKWFCTVTQNVGVIAKTTSLQEAQSALGQDNAKNRQAIIPMTGMEAGDPHSLPKKWSNGSMWWWNWPDINQMRAKCSQVRPVCDGYQPGTTPDPWFTDEPDWFTDEPDWEVTDEPHVDHPRPR